MSFHLHNKSFQVCSVVPIFINQKTKAKSLCSLSVHSMVEQGTECKIVPPDCHFLPTSCSCCSAPKAELKPNRPLVLDRRGSKGTMLCFFPLHPRLMEMPAAKVAEKAAAHQPWNQEICLLRHSSGDLASPQELSYERGSRGT